MRPWTFNHEEALCLHCKQGALGRLRVALGRVENHPGEGSLREPWLHACIWEQVSDP